MGVGTAEVFNVVIIGAGQIGAFYDKPNNENILTHAHAVTVHPGFKLLGFYDKDHRQATMAVSAWGGEAFSDWGQLRSAQHIDVVCLTVPDEYHYTYLKELANWDIKVVFAEKPLVQNLEQVKEVKQLYSRSPISLAVNYSRRFVPEIIRLREDIQQGKYGAYITGTGYYGKGLLHNGSHMIDLLRYLVGEVYSFLILDQINDFYSDDPTVAAVLELEQGGRFYLQGVDCREYTMFEMDLVFRKGRVRMVDTGFSLVEYGIRDNQVFQAYRNMVKTGEQPTSLKRALYYAFDNIYQHLTEGQALRCGLDDGCKVIGFCQQLKTGQVP